MTSLKEKKAKVARETRLLRKELEQVGILYQDKASKSKDNPFFTTLLKLILPKLIKLAGIYFSGKFAYRLTDKTIDAVTTKIANLIEKHRIGKAVGRLTQE